MHTTIPRQTLRPPATRGAPGCRPLGAAALTGALLLTACAGADSATRSGGPPREGGELRFALASDPVCVDPHQRANNDAIYPARQLVDSLTDQDPETGEIVPWLAERWEVDDDAAAYTFWLRRDATFSDGTPVDAEAVRNTFDAIVELGASAPLGSSYLAGYTGTEVLDDHTARVTFEEPNAQFLQATSTFSLGLLAESTTALPAHERCTGGLIGSGPFVLEEYTPNESVVQSRREDYAWGSSLWEKEGPAYLETLTFVIVPEAGVRSGALRSGQADAIGGVAPHDEEVLEGAGLTLQSRANPGLPFALHANADRPALSDARVRRAVSLAIDRQEVVDTVLSSSFLPATGALAHTTDTYLDQSEELAHDPEAAARLLTEAGWEPGADGVRVRDGEQLSLTVIWADHFGPNRDALQLVQQQLRESGIDLVLEVTPLSEFSARQESGEFDFSWSNTTRTDPDILRTQFSADLANIGNLPEDSPLQTALDGQNAEAAAQERAGVSHEAQRLLLAEAYQIPVFELTTVLGIAPHVHGLGFEASSRLQFHDTWVE